MPIMDAELLLSEDQDLAQVAASYNSTNVVDFGAGKDHLAAATVLDAGESGRQQWINIVVTETFTSGGAATLAVALQDSADNVTFAATVPAISVAAIALATLAAGYVILRMPLPPDLKRYLKIVYTIGTATTTAGKVTAWIGPSGQD